MEPAIRRAGPGDADAVLALIAEYCAADAHEFDPAVAGPGLMPLLESDDFGVVLVVDADDGLDGYAALTWGWSIEIGGPEAVIDEIYVRTRNRGRGSDLLRAAEEECRRRGFRRLFMETEQPNDAARRLYRRHGYGVESSIWMAKILR